MSENKYAVILHNYNYPSDRFNPTYAKPGKNKLVLNLIDIAGKQGLVQGVEMNMDESDDSTCVGINENRYSPQECQGTDAGDKCQSRCDDFISRSHAQFTQRKMNRGSAA